MLRIGELARIAGVTTRLLRHYESVGVFAPALTDSRTGYRFYDRAQIQVLQQILAYRDTGVPLGAIAECRDLGSMLAHQREALIAQRAVIDQRLAALDATSPRPFRIKRTSPAWIASVRQSVATYDAADDMIRALRGEFAAETSAAIWHCCRPDEGRIDCEAQVVFRRPAPRLRELSSQLVVSFAHTGPDAELPMIYREMHDWSRAARLSHAGPLREIYWNGVIEIQLPVRPTARTGRAVPLVGDR